MMMVRMTIWSWLASSKYWRETLWKNNGDGQIETPVKGLNSKQSLPLSDGDKDILVRWLYCSMEHVVLDSTQRWGMLAAIHGAGLGCGAFPLMFMSGRSQGGVVAVRNNQALRPLKWKSHLTPFRRRVRTQFGPNILPLKISICTTVCP